MALPTNTACAVGGNAQPSGTVVTALGNVVVVVVVVVVVNGATHPTTGIVVTDGSTDGGHNTGTVVVVVVVVVAPETDIGVINITAAAAIGMAARKRRILDTLLMMNARDWALQQRYWRHGIQPDSQTSRT